MATASSITDRTKFHASEFQAYFANPYNTGRTLLLFIWDVILEKWQFRQNRKNNVQPILDKHHRGGVYPLIRATMTTIMRELNIYTLLGDMFAGRPSAYATFVGYDEIAHHSGIYDPGAFDALHKLDQQFARIESASKEAPRPYHLVILSDHGQTGGATFQQRYDMSLEEFVQKLMTFEYRVQGATDSGESISKVNIFLTDAIANEDSSAVKALSRVFKPKTVDGEVALEGKGDKPKEKEVAEETAVVVLASGNLGLISFTHWDHRMTFEEIDAAFPAVIPGLIAHEGVGFVMVNTENEGAVVVGRDGRYYLADDRIEGENPLANFGARAPQHLRRTSSFPNCPDILVNSFYDPETNEGCAFEELIGFHGGMGGTQTQPFILHPAGLKVEGELVGAADVYKTCKRWLNELHKSQM